MRALRIAVILDQKVQAGGGYQQSLSAAVNAMQLPKELADLEFFTTVKENIQPLAAHGINATFINVSLYDKFISEFQYLLLKTRIKKFLMPLDFLSFERKLLDKKIDIVYFLSPSINSKYIKNLNFIMTIWDLCHRDNPEFPEVRWDLELELRDQICWSALPRATAIFVDSLVTKTNVVRRYGIDEHRVHIVPFQAAIKVRRRDEKATKMDRDAPIKKPTKYPYVFYPAQFWAHKNHVYILEGLHLLERDYGIKVGAIFSGSDKGNLDYIRTYSKRLNLEGRVEFVGFVKDEDIVDLYKAAIALVMPSYFGPTNLPPLEAFELGVPVLYPDISGLRDQVGDAALLMDLMDPSSMASHLNNLLSDDKLKLRLVEAGRRRLQYIEETDRLNTLSKIIEEYRWKRLTWE